ncbi:MAG: hypothetical protein QF454_00255 [Candidatus Thalassarchaeaceae archaeon]|nr:hypothetical protein [Candidatus Thalassarchaeaceae archaeon]
MKNGTLECKSCNHEVATHREETGMALCDICAPWVESSLRRTGEIPSWAPSFCDERQDMFYDTRKAITKYSKIREGRGHWVRGDTSPCPITERGWNQFLEYVMGEDAKGILIRTSNGIDMREDAIGLSNSVSAIQNHLRLADENTEHLFGHSIRLDGNSIWINDVLFGPKACEIHCQNRRILPQLIFDRYHGLDERSIEDMAYVYMRGPWIPLIRETTNARVPTSFALREEICRIADGTHGDEPADRLRAALLLWSTEVEREFLTCPPSSWARSFQWIREIAADFSAEVEIAGDGIYVTGSSKNMYRIAPTAPNGRADRFEVSRILNREDDDSSEAGEGEESVPICIHSMSSDEEDLERPLGDVIVNLILALRDDLQTAEKIPQLFRHLPGEFQTRRRGGDRRYWRQRWGEYMRRNEPEEQDGPLGNRRYREMRIAVRAARAALGELGEEE